ncbi:MAG: NADH-quinone oxidoreductase subunit NuoK [Ardenticatenales bacterium]|nr:NADH-quinone oxidoreductase subunit NuoK [Ardenticatenales bacterium]
MIPLAAVLPPAQPLMLAALLFTIGAAGVLLRRNIIIVLMSVELMLNAVNITLVAVSRAMLQLDGQVFVFFSLTIAAAEVAVGLALVVALHRSLGSSDVDDVSSLRG